MITRRQILAATCVPLLGAQARSQSGAQIRFDGVVFCVDGWTPPAAEPPEGWAGLLAVYSTGSEDVPPMLGAYFVKEGALCFRPRFLVNVKVRALFRAPGAPPVEAAFARALRETKPTARVEQVYPSSDVLPANLLRFYLQFSRPMRRGEAWEHIRLLNRDGKPLDLPFLELEQELWDADGKRLTVLFDPGRIKRGVLPRDEAGTSLTEGSSYTLVIDATWRDRDGAPMVKEFRKLFRVVPEARQPIDLKTWRMEMPRAGSSQPLMVHFPAPLDYALLHRLLEVHGDAGRLAGKATVRQRETQWIFTPDAPWRPGGYRLQVDTALEDVAGNRVGKPFDVDVFDKITTKITRQFESIPFRVST